MRKKSVSLASMQITGGGVVAVLTNVTLTAIQHEETSSSFEGSQTHDTMKDWEVTAGPYPQATGGVLYTVESADYSGNCYYAASSHSGVTFQGTGPLVGWDLIAP